MQWHEMSAKIYICADSKSNAVEMLRLVLDQETIMHEILEVEGRPWDEADRWKD